MPSNPEWNKVLGVVQEEAKKIIANNPNLKYSEAVKKAWKTPAVKSAHEKYKKTHGGNDSHSYTAHEVEGGAHKHRAVKKPARKPVKKTVKKPARKPTARR